MKKSTRVFILSVLLSVLAVSAKNSFAQDDLPWFIDQHGNNGDQSPHGAPLDGGSEIFLVLGTGYAIKKISGIRKKSRISR